MNPIFTKMVDAVEAANAAPDDYINPADGLKYCGKCRTPKEAFFPADLQAEALPSTRLCASALPNAGSLNSTSAVQWQFEGKFTIEKRKPLCYNYKMHRGFFS